MDIDLLFEEVFPDRQTNNFLSLEDKFLLIKEAALCGRKAVDACKDMHAADIQITLRAYRRRETP